ncbi:protein of unknown function [Pararobbsia alpina]
MREWRRTNIFHVRHIDRDRIDFSAKGVNFSLPEHSSSGHLLDGGGFLPMRFFCWQPCAAALFLFFSGFCRGVHPERSDPPEP